MKKIFIAIAAIVCCAFTSCVNNDNPVETAEDNVPLAEAIKLYTAPQSFYKLDTKEVLPIYVVVDSKYEVNGEKKYYDLSKITEVSISENDFFSVDATPLVKYGYIKLVPKADHPDFLDLVDDVENYGAYSWTDKRTITMKNKKGEVLEQTVDVKYLMKTEFNLKETVKVDDLKGENHDEYVVKVTNPFKLYDWSFERYGDKVKTEMNYLLSAEIKDDGLLHIVTDGAPTDEGDPNTLKYTFERKLVGSPTPELPEGEGVMVNFRVNLELNVTE